MLCVFFFFAIKTPYISKEKIRKEKKKMREETKQQRKRSQSASGIVLGGNAQLVKQSGGRASAGTWCDSAGVLVLVLAKGPHPTAPCFVAAAEERWERAQSCGCSSPFGGRCRDWKLALK